MSGEITLYFLYVIIKCLICELQIYFNKNDGQVVRKYNAKLALPDPVCSHAQISENLCVAL